MQRVKRKTRYYGRTNVTTKFFFFSTTSEYKFLATTNGIILSCVCYNEAYLLYLNFFIKDIYQYTIKNETLTVIFTKHTRFKELAYYNLMRSLQFVFKGFIKKMRLQGRLYRIYCIYIEEINIYETYAKNKIAYAEYSGRCIIRYRVGYKHLNVIYLYDMNIKYKKKRKFFLVGYDFNLISNRAKSIVNIYPQNIYTHRGVRLKGKRSRRRYGKSLTFNKF